MGFFNRKSEIENFILFHGGRLWQKITDDDRASVHRWSRSSKSWVLLFATACCEGDLEMINKFWPNVLRGSRNIEIAFNELAAYYVFRTLQIGDGGVEDDGFIRHNQTDRQSFIKEVCEIMDLSLNQQNRIDYYIQNYGMGVMKKFFEAPEFTAELGIEHTALAIKEMEDLLKAIANGVKVFQDIPTPDKSVIEQIQQERQITGIAFSRMLEQNNLIPDPRVAAMKELEKRAR